MKTYLEIHEVEQLESAARYLRDKLLIMLLFRLGCRISEALALKVSDIDFAQGTVTIEHLKSRVKLSCPQCGTRLGKSHKYCPTCGNGVVETLAQEREHRRVRTLPIDRETLNILQEYVNRDGKRLVFGITRIRVWQIIRECSVRAGASRLINPATRRRKSHRITKTSPVRSEEITTSG